MGKQKKGAGGRERRKRGVKEFVGVAFASSATNAKASPVAGIRNLIN